MGKRAVPQAGAHALEPRGPRGVTGPPGSSDAPSDFCGKHPGLRVD